MSLTRPLLGQTCRSRFCGESFGRRVQARLISTRVSPEMKRLYESEIEKYSTQIHDALKLGRKPSQNLLKMLMRNLSKMHKVKEGFELMQLMRAEQILPEAPFMADMMNMLRLTGDDMGVLKLYNGFIRAGCLPNEDLFLVLAKMYRFHGDWRAVGQVFNHMNSFNMNPGSGHYECYIEACGKAGRIDLAEKTFDHYAHVKKHYRPHIDVVKAMMRAYLRCGDHQKLMHMYNDLLKQYELNPDEECVQILILSHAKRKNYVEAHHLFRERVKSGSVSQKLQLTMQNVHASAGNIAEAKRLFEQVTGTSDERNVAHFNALLMAYDNAKKYDTLNQRVERMKCEGYVADAETYRIRINAAAKRGKFSDVFAIYEEIRRARGQMDRKFVTFPLVVAAKQLDVKHCKRLLKVMRAEEIQPTEEMRAAFAYAQVLNNNMDDALQNFVLASPHQAYLRAVLTALIHTNNSDDTLMLFEKLAVRKKLPEKETLKTILSMLYRERRTSALKSTLERYADITNDRDHEIVTYKLYLATEENDPQAVKDQTEKMISLALPIESSLLQLVNSFVIRNRRNMNDEMNDWFTRAIVGLTRLSRKDGFYRPRSLPKPVPSQIFMQRTLDNLHNFQDVERIVPNVTDASPTEVICRLNFAR